MLSSNDIKIDRVKVPGLFSWLHISDIHFGEKNAEDKKIILAKLVQDIQNCRVRHNIDPDVVFITGDLAWSGKTAQYNDALKFIESVMKAANVGEKRLFLVPGNHDVDRSNTRRLSLELLQDFIVENAATDPHKRVTEFLRNDEHRHDRATLFRKHANYVQFIKREFPHINLRPPPLSFVSRLLLSEIGMPHSVWVLGLNTAWLGRDNESQGKLLLGRTQLLEAISIIQEVDNVENDLVIALTHHPLSWLAEWDARDCRRLLASHCDFHLSGHVHEQWLSRQGLSSAGTCWEIPAGAAHGDSEYFNGYNFVRVNFHNLRAELFTRAYIRTVTDKWIPDPSTGDDRQGFLDFELPKKFRSVVQKSVPTHLVLPHNGKQLDSYAPELMLIPEPADIESRCTFRRLTCSIKITKGLDYKGRYAFFGKNTSQQSIVHFQLPFVIVGGLSDAEVHFRAYSILQPEEELRVVIDNNISNNVNKFHVLVFYGDRNVIHPNNEFAFCIDFFVPRVMRREDDYDIFSFMRFGNFIGEFSYSSEFEGTPSGVKCYLIQDNSLTEVAFQYASRPSNKVTASVQITGTERGFLLYYNNLE